MAVTVDYTPAIFNYWLSGIDDAIDAGIVTTDSGLYTQTAIIDGVTWTKTHEGSVQAAAGTATDTHVITSSDGFYATGVELVNNYTRATLDSEEDWVAFDDNIDSETWTGDFGNFTVTFSDIGTTYTDIFTGTMTTVSGDLLENVNIVVTFEGDSDFPSALEGTAILNGETVTFDSSLLSEPPVVDTVVVDTVAVDTVAVDTVAVDAVAVDAVVVTTDTTVINDSDYIVLSNANLKDDSYPTATFTGNIEANGSVDTYVITAQAGEAFIFDVEHQDAPGEIDDSYIRLYDESGNELARNDDSSGGGGANESGGTNSHFDSYLEYTFASAGTYTLTVRGYADANTGTYGINISKVSTSPVNTPAVITAENATISENQNEVSGIATHTDVDTNNNDNVFQTATNATATYGTYSVTTDGNWTYSLDNTNTDVDALNISDALTDTITITAEDGTTESVIVTINGTNDAATVSSAVVALDETDVALTTSGTLTATDVDNIDNTFTASATTGTIGDFAIDVDGNWTFTANAAFDELNVGDSYSETYNVASVDGTPSTVEITINGTSDIDVMIKTVNGDYLDNATIKYILEDVETNISTLVKEGSIDVVENVAFDEVKIAENDAHISGVSIADAVNIYDHLVGLNIIETNSLYFHAADVDNNNEITISDAVIIEKHLANLTSIDTFDLIDEQGNRVTQLDINALDSNVDNFVIPTWTIVENGDVNLDSSFNTDYIVSASDLV
jgi:VCBS repeat-containing protein